MFKTNFDNYVCEGDTIECTVEGLTIIASIVRDYDYHIDDDFHIDDDDCHNVDQDVTGLDDEQQTKLIAARKAWKNDEWFYCGISLAVHKCGICLSKYAARLWGIEANYPGNDNSYLAEIANELLDEATTEGKRVLAELTNGEE